MMHGKGNWLLVPLRPAKGSTRGFIIMELTGVFFFGAAAAVAAVVLADTTTSAEVCFSCGGDGTAGKICFSRNMCNVDSVLT